MRNLKEWTSLMPMPTTHRAFIAFSSSHCLRQPGPELESDPVHHVMRPNPGQLPSVDLDLAHAFHRWAEPVRNHLGQATLDAEKVSAFFRRGHRRDLRHGNGKSL